MDTLPADVLISILTFADADPVLACVCHDWATVVPHIVSTSDSKASLDAYLGAMGIVVRSRRQYARMLRQYRGVLSQSFSECAYTCSRCGCRLSSVAEAHTCLSRWRVLSRVALGPTAAVVGTALLVHVGPQLLVRTRVARRS